MKSRLLTLLAVFWIHTAAVATQPNFVFILADDLGWTDIGAYASAAFNVPTSELYYETPALDKLAAESTRFTQAYANPLCSPTRASVITGKYAARLGFTTAASPNYPHDPDTKISLPQRSPNYAGLRNAQTRMGLPAEEKTIAEALNGYRSAFIGKWHLGAKDPKWSPKSQGFEEIAYYDSGGTGYWDWSQWLEPGEPSGETYQTDHLAFQAKHFLESQSNQSEPFFLYICPFAVHTPIQAKEEDIAHFKKKKAFKGHNNPTYAGMLKSLDDLVGTVMTTLEKEQLLENTVVIFMSDNGGLLQIGGRNGGKITDLTSNAPLRGGKAMVWEGGIRVPLMLRLPESIARSQPAVVNTPVICNDIYPTVLNLAGIKDPDYNNDGVDLLPLLRGQKIADRILFWHYPFWVEVRPGMAPLPPHSAMRDGDMKLIWNQQGKLELYDLSVDISEEHDLSSSQPELTQTMFARLVAGLNYNVEDTFRTVPNPQYNPKIQPPGDVPPFRDLEKELVH
ncbi:sulfatase [Coraliomargarita sp. W4R53]